MASATPINKREDYCAEMCTNDSLNRHLRRPDVRSQRELYPSLADVEVILM